MPLQYRTKQKPMIPFRLPHKKRLCIEAHPFAATTTFYSSLNTKHVGQGILSYPDTTHALYTIQDMTLWNYRI